MPTARVTRAIAAPAGDIWTLVSDPYHLPRWWPRVNRVEQVDEHGFTEVMQTSKGKTVRADFSFIERDEGARRICWSQQVAGTPFEGVLSSSETELSLRALEGALTEVTLELRQELSGPRGPASPQPSRFRRPVLIGFGARMVLKAARGTLEDALEGLERISA